MHRLLLSAFCLLTSALVCTAAETIRIPDPVFLNRLLALGVDLNDDGKIQTDEAAQVTELKLDELGILNAEGLNKFTNVHTVYLRRNQLTSIDISGMTALREILLLGNRISLIKFKNLPNLEELEIAQNPIRGPLDLTALKKLKGFYAYECGLTALNVSGLTHLVNLMVRANAIPELDLRGMTKLEDLRIEQNRFTRLDLTGLSSLQDVWAEGNAISDLKTAGANALEFIQLQGNRITSYDFTHAPNLKTINVSRNPLTSIDVRGLTKLEALFCDGCLLTTLNLSGTYRLRELQWWPANLTP